MPRYMLYNNSNSGRESYFHIYTTPILHPHRQLADKIVIPLHQQDWVCKTVKLGAARTTPEVPDKWVNQVRGYLLSWQ